MRQVSNAHALLLFPPPVLPLKLPSNPGLFTFLLLFFFPLEPFSSFRFRRLSSLFRCLISCPLATPSSRPCHSFSLFFFALSCRLSAFFSNDVSSRTLSPCALFLALSHMSFSSISLRFASSRPARRDILLCAALNAVAGSAGPLCWCGSVR